MKTLIFVLIIASFIQSTILPIDLVLIILICRSYVKSDQANLFLAFGFGLLDAHLNLTPLGLQSLVYSLAVAVTEGLSKSRLAGNSLMIIPISLVLLLINQLPLVFLRQAFPPFPKIFIEACLSLPILYLIRWWEERFIIQKQIRLKV